MTVTNEQYTYISRRCNDLEAKNRDLQGVVEDLNTALGSEFSNSSALRADVERLTKQKAEAIERRNDGLNYIIELQRLVEALCHGNDIPSCSKALHHQAMAERATAGRRDLRLDVARKDEALRGVVDCYDENQSLGRRFLDAARAALAPAQPPKLTPEKIDGLVAEGIECRKELERRMKPVEMCPALGCGPLSECPEPSAVEAKCMQGLTQDCQVHGCPKHDPKPAPDVAKFDAEIKDAWLRERYNALLSENAELKRELEAEKLGFNSSKRESYIFSLETQVLELKRRLDLVCSDRDLSHKNDLISREGWQAANKRAEAAEAQLRNIAVTGDLLVITARERDAALARIARAIEALSTSKKGAWPAAYEALAILEGK